MKKLMTLTLVLLLALSACTKDAPASSSAAEAAAPTDVSVSVPEASEAESPAVTTLSLYAQDGDTMGFVGIPFGMTPSETMELLDDEDTWTLHLDSGKPVITGVSPYPDHPEITQLDLMFNFHMETMSLRLDVIDVTYDKGLISKDGLLNQRTGELGPPTTEEDGSAFWFAGPATNRLQGTYGLIVAENPDGVLMERIGKDANDYFDPTETGYDIPGYIDHLQPAYGRFGGTFEENVAEGYIDPDTGTYEVGDEKGTFHLFTTTVTVEGQALDAEYIFTKTLANQGRDTEYLSEIYVYPPSDAKLEDWLAPISKTWSDYQSTDGTSWASYYTLGMVLTQQQKDVIQPQLDASQMTGTLDQWCLSEYFYRSDKGAWVFNGTGIALYTAAQEIE